MKSKAPYTADTINEASGRSAPPRVERTLLSAAFDLELDFFEQKRANEWPEGALSLRVLCARGGFHGTVHLWDLYST